MGVESMIAYQFVMYGAVMLALSALYSFVTVTCLYCLIFREEDEETWLD